MYGKVQESGLIEVIPLIMYLTHLEPVSCVFTSWVSSGLTVECGCSLMAARWQVFFPSWVSSGLTKSPWVVATMANDCNIQRLLTWQEIFIYHQEPEFNPLNILKERTDLLYCIVLFSHEWAAEWLNNNKTSVSQSSLTLQPHGLQHSRLLRPPLSPGVCSNSSPLGQLC